MITSSRYPLFEVTVPLSSAARRWQTAIRILINRMCRVTLMRGKHGSWGDPGCCGERGCVFCLICVCSCIIIRVNSVWWFRSMLLTGLSNTIFYSSLRVNVELQPPATQFWGKSAAEVVQVFICFKDYVTMSVSSGRDRNVMWQLCGVKHL